MCLGIKSVEGFLTLLLFSKCLIINDAYGKIRCVLVSSINKLRIKIMMYFVFFSSCLIINNVLLQGQEQPSDINCCLTNAFEAFLVFLNSRIAMIFLIHFI